MTLTLTLTLLLLLAICCPANETVKIHIKGRKPQVNVYSAIDSRRPLIGMRVAALTGAGDRHSMPRLRTIWEFSMLRHAGGL